MKKQYIHPTTQIVKTRRRAPMLCSSPYNGVSSLRTYSSDDDAISDKDEIW